MKKRKPRKWKGTVEWIAEARSGDQDFWWELATDLSTKKAAIKAAREWLTDPETWPGSAARVRRRTVGIATEVLL